jgi:hypothetical protein
MHQQVEYFNNCKLCPHCVYMFCVCLRTNSDLCHLHQNLVGFFITEMKSVYSAIRTGPLKWSGLRSVFYRLNTSIGFIICTGILFIILLLYINIVIIIIYYHQYHTLWSVLVIMFYTPQKYYKQYYFLEYTWKSSIQIETCCAEYRLLL